MTFCDKHRFVKHAKQITYQDKLVVWRDLLCATYYVDEDGRAAPKSNVLGVIGEGTYPREGTRIPGA